MGLLLLQDRRMQTRRPLFAKACQALIFPDGPHAEPLPESGIRQQVAHEPCPAAKPLRRLLRGYLVRDVQLRRDRGASSVRQQQRPPHRERICAVQVRGQRAEGVRYAEQSLVRGETYLLRAEPRDGLSGSVLSVE